MMTANACCVPNCREIRRPGRVSIHRLPNDVESREVWRNAIGGADYHLPKTGRICSKHFQIDEYEKRNGKRAIKRGAVPTIFTYASSEETHGNDENNSALPDAADAASKVQRCNRKCYSGDFCLADMHDREMAKKFFKRIKIETKHARRELHRLRNSESRIRMTLKGLRANKQPVGKPEISKLKVHPASSSVMHLDIEIGDSDETILKQLPVLGIVKHEPPVPNGTSAGANSVNIPALMSPTTSTADLSDLPVISDVRSSLSPVLPASANITTSASTTSTNIEASNIPTTLPSTIVTNISGSERITTSPSTIVSNNQVLKGITTSPTTIVSTTPVLKGITTSRSTIVSTNPVLKGITTSRSTIVSNNPVLKHITTSPSTIVSNNSPLKSIPTLPPIPIHASQILPHFSPSSMLTTSPSTIVSDISGSESITTSPSMIVSINPVLESITTSPSTIVSNKPALKSITTLPPSILPHVSTTRRISHPRVPSTPYSNGSDKTARQKRVPTDNLENRGGLKKRSANPSDNRDEFAIFGEFVATKLRDFKNRPNQLKTQNRITSILLEMKMEDMDEPLNLVTERHN